MEESQFELRSEDSWSEAVQIIAAELAGLKGALEPLLKNQALPSALPAFPNFPGLSYDLIQEAMRDADIATLGDQRVAPVGAAAAANGIGLCQNFTDIEACENEEASMPMSRVLAVEYTKTALTITLSPFQASRKGFDWTIDRAWDLGANALKDSNGEQDAEVYWQRVRDEIQKIPARMASDKPVSRVLVMGESALVETFLRVMNDALHDVLDTGALVEVYDSQMLDPAFAAARGAAEFGKRLMEGPDGCTELAICKWWRRRIG